MTVREAIDGAKALLGNEIPEATQIRWLNELDEQIWRDLILTHEPEATIAGGYEAHTQDTDELLVPDFASGLYIEYLIMQINMAHGETDRYNAAAAVFNSKLKSYSQWYNRNNLPVRGPHLAF